MARRTMTIKRVDPWSVMKVGFLANLVLLGILLLAGRVVWFFIERLELVTKACEAAVRLGFDDCGVNGGNIFRNAMLLGLLGVVVQTGIVVFGAFLFNLIAELTGGLTLGVEDDLPAKGGAAAAAKTSRSHGRSKPEELTTAKGHVAEPAPTGLGKVAAVAQTAAQTVAGAAAGAASTAAEAARQAAAKAQAARADAEERAKAQAAADAARQAQARPADPVQQPQPPAQPRPASQDPAPTQVAKPSEDLFGSRTEPKGGPQGPFQP